MSRALILAALLMSACMSARPIPTRAQLPEGKRCLFVPIFVDRTDDGSASRVITEAVRRRVYERAPRAFRMEFADECVALDGQILAVSEDQTPAGDVLLSLRVDAGLTTRAGRYHDLGKAQARTTFTPAREQRVTEQRRVRALRSAALEVADELIERAWSGATDAT